MSDFPSRSSRDVFSQNSKRAVSQSTRSILSSGSNLSGEKGRAARNQSSFADLDEDANIWRLVSRDTEKTQMNYGGGGGPSSEQAAGSSYQHSGQRRQRFVPRKVHMLYLLVALFMFAALFGVLYQDKSRPHRSHAVQGQPQQQFAAQHQAVSHEDLEIPSYGGSFRGASDPGATIVGPVSEDIANLPVINEYGEAGAQEDQSDHGHYHEPEQREGPMVERSSEPEETSDPFLSQPSTELDEGTENGLEEQKLLVDQYVPIVTTTTSIRDLTGYKPTWAPSSSGDVPVFFNLAYQITGARIFKDILGICHHLTISSEDVRPMLPNLDQEEIQVLNIDDPDKERLSLATIDTTILSELVRGERLGLAQSGLVDFIMVRHLYEANKLFDQDHQGRIFGVFRDPVHSAWGAYIVVEYTHPHLKNMTFDEFADSNIAEDNWMVRALSNQPMDVELTRDHLKEAIEFVRDKVLVGLISHRDESIGRFEEFFGWKYREDPLKQEECRQDFLNGLGNEKHRRIAPDKNLPPPKVAAPKPGDEIYEKLAAKNHFDMSLYKHIEEVFMLQASLFSSETGNYRLEGATCCMCDASC